eukprot:5778064-Karenia_brevis.AAC.1
MQATIAALRQQVRVMQHVIEEQQKELDTYDVVAGHTTPAHFDALGADHASPVLFDLFDAES